LIAFVCLNPSPNTPRLAVIIRSSVWEPNGLACRLSLSLRCQINRFKFQKVAKTANPPPAPDADREIFSPGQNIAYPGLMDAADVRLFDAVALSRPYAIECNTGSGFSSPMIIRVPFSDRVVRRFQFIFIPGTALAP
jgi:hypothetical protein